MVSKAAAKKRRKREDLLAEGLRILAEHGEAALSIEALCAGFGLTKGSFYHHFASREDFSRNLLEYWTEEHTARFIDMCRRSGGARDQYCTLDGLAPEVDGKIEVAVRAWALRDPLAREYLERVDTMRLDYLKGLYADMLGDPDEAERLAVLEYAAFIGSRLVMPPLPESLIHRLPDCWVDMLKAYLAARETKPEDP